MEFLNKNPWWTAPEGNNKIVNDEVRLYEQYCVQGGVAAEHLRATQDCEDNSKTGGSKHQQKSIQTKPSLHQKVLATYKQDSEGVLFQSSDNIRNAKSRTLTPKQQELSSGQQ